MEDEIAIFNETNACNELIERIDISKRLVLIELPDGFWSVSVQDFSDNLLRKPINLSNTVSSETRLGAWQLMRLQLEGML